jgi:hypothetical protein
LARKRSGPFEHGNWGRGRRLTPCARTPR